jgi:hypothetical protein
MLGKHCTRHAGVAAAHVSLRPFQSIVKLTDLICQKPTAMEGEGNLRYASGLLQAFDHLLQTVHKTLGPVGAWIFIIVFPIIALVALLYWVNQRDEGWKEALKGKEKDIQRLADDNRTLRVQALIHGGMAPDMAERNVMKNVPPDGPSSRRQLENDLKNRPAVKQCLLPPLFSQSGLPVLLSSLE